ncbi:MAG: hypothetical protein LBJ39_01975 [Tannerellaceae bacterium]|jgi:hypothetical protein|nr:hypothetical protein [Tannerellaceae bacterium]
MQTRGVELRLTNNNKTKQTQEYSGNIPADNNTELQEVVSGLHGAEERILLHDVREREIPRPQDEEVQKEK